MDNIEMYKIAQLAVLNDPHIEDMQKLEVLKMLFDKEDLERCAKKMREEREAAGNG